MKIFTATPEEFGNGSANVKAVDLFRGRELRKKRAPRKYYPPGAKQPMQVGTITPADFEAGRPYDNRFGANQRAGGHRTGPVNALKPLPEARQIYHVQVGKTYWFEYHCWESDDSGDADLWYHSHQQAVVVKQTQTGHGKTEDERADNGHNAHYLVRFADGKEFEAGEDELMDSRESFCRPDPPLPLEQRKSKRRITLKEALPTEDDPELGAAHMTRDDEGALLAAALRDELVEKGWRQIKVFKDDRTPDTYTWRITAAYVDYAYRGEWLAAGARVAPTPVMQPTLKTNLTRMLQAALRRIKVQGGCYISALETAHDAYDLETEYADFEDDRGDWNIEGYIVCQPQPGFWSKASQTTGYK